MCIDIRRIWREPFGGGESVTWTSHWSEGLNLWINFIGEWVTAGHANEPQMNPIAVDAALLQMPNCKCCNNSRRGLQHGLQ